ncbi:universal stress protein [Iningainema tapete]|uniref:Universal stress protein n=1 Tax=Iningainema tapete BLCC-T55 TaxID=2748662 RepID=A0A8J6XI44_9CYAN|nr:universal stress protein [Iningainema tapete BLCC-T55]
MLKTILVALDDSDIKDKVIETLQQLMVSEDTKVILSHVFPTLESQIEIPADRPLSATPALSYLQVEKQLQSYQAQLSVKSELEMVTGDPAEEIIRLANIYKADLIVIGSRGLTGMNRIVQGSVSGEVVEQAPCSVLVVKHK